MVHLLYFLKTLLFLFFNPLQNILGIIMKCKKFPENFSFAAYIFESDLTF